MIIRFTIGPCKRKAWDSNPHPRQGARISSAARQAVSGYLPNCQWTHPELNWDLRHARAVSSPWTMSPCCRVDRRGLEPRSPGCKGQVSCRWTSSPRCQRSVRESNPTLVLTKDVCCHNTYRPSFSVIPAGIEPAISWVSSRRLRHWTTGSCFSDRGGSRTRRCTGSRPVRFASLRTRSCPSSGSGGRTRQSRLMRPE
jgi:hypothetical protein